MIIAIATLSFILGANFGYLAAAWLSGIEAEDREAQRSVAAYRKRNQVIVDLPRHWGEG